MAEKKTFRILHLTPHAGGGVGTVLCALLAGQRKSFKVQLCSLEYLNEFMKNWCRHHGIDFLESGWQQQNPLYLLLEQADIVHIHWWNHPLLHALLTSGSLPLMRTVIWSHVNGLHVPQTFFDALLSFPDRFVLATPQSLQSHTVQRFHDNSCRKLQVIQSNAGIPTTVPRDIPVRTEFQACYIGTVDYSKMHRNFIKLWLQTGIRDNPLVVCGGPSDDRLTDEITRQNCLPFFDVRGSVHNVPEILSHMDLFFYPLQQTHYGTGEQVLIEAMAFGVVPVVFGGGCEEFVVDNGQTGIVARDEKEFVDSVQMLYESPDERKRLAMNAMTVVQKKFKMTRTLSDWENVYAHLMTNDKREHSLLVECFNGVPLSSPLALMLTSYGQTTERDIFLRLLDEATDEKKALDFSPALFSKTRGAPFHYYHFFPDDDNLHHLCEKISLLQETCEPAL